VAKLHDANIPSDQIEALGQKLAVGNAAVIVVIETTYSTGAHAQLSAAGGEVAAVGVTSELKAALESLAPGDTVVAASA
jgi:uncharacterized membrane protein